MTDRKIYCPTCEKWLGIINENKEENNAENLRAVIKLKLWCKECKKEVTVEI